MSPCTSKMQCSLGAMLLVLFGTILTCNAIHRFEPTCEFPANDQGYQPWSSPATWRGIFNGVPGIGYLKNAVVTIPCGKKVILDVKDIVLRTLDIQGALTVKDDGRTQYTVSADRILVQGQFKIGSPAQPFRAKIIFTLTNNDRASYFVRRPSARSPGGYQVTGKPVPLGDKLFGVVGGRVLFYGIGLDVPAWVSLGSTASPGSNYIIVRGNVAKWPVGAQIGLTTTSFNDGSGTNNEVAKIVSVRPMGGGQTQIVLDHALRYEHTCRNKRITPNRWFELCGHVALLSRNIVIKGAPARFIGGHFMVAFTPAAQHIQGVEFVDMGQQGRLARYPVHFHLGLNGQGTTITKNAVHSSKQRCYVIHGHDDIKIIDNVCFNAAGTGIAIEDGLEHRNLIEHNLVAGLSRPSIRIDVSREPAPPAIVDEEPPAIWSKNPTNPIVENVVCGAFTGIWVDLTDRVIGPCSAIEGADRIKPWGLRFASMGGNMAYVTRVGFRVYPFYHAPANGKPVVSNFRAWRITSRAIELREVHGFTIRNAQAYNFLKGVNLIATSDIDIVDSLFVSGQDDIVRAPKRDTYTFPCPTRPRGSIFWYNFGVMVNTAVPVEYGRKVAKGVTIYGTTFAGFKPSCIYPAAALGILSLSPTVNRASDRFLVASNRMWNIRIDSTTPAVFVATKDAATYRNPTDQPYSMSFQLLGNSVMGQPGVFISEEYFTKLFSLNGRPSPLPRNCKRDPKALQSVFCTNACVRTVLIRWPGTCPSGVIAATLRRVSDGAVAQLRAYKDNLNRGSITTTVNLFAGTYELRQRFKAYRATPPVISNFDYNGCNGVVNIIVK